MRKQVKLKPVPAFFPAVVLLVIFSGCVGVHKWLTVDMLKEPAAVFECDAEEAGGDALILLGIRDASIIAGYREWKPIGFFLKTTNTEPPAAHLPFENSHRFVHFVPVDNQYVDSFAKDFPKLAGMKLFALYLKGKRVKQESCQRYKKLGDGDLKNMLPRQIEYVKNRRIRLIAVSLTGDNGARYRQKIENTFQPDAP